MTARMRAADPTQANKAAQHLDNAQELDDADLDAVVGGAQFTTAGVDLKSKTSGAQKLDLGDHPTPDIITAPGQGGGPR